METLLPCVRFYKCRQHDLSYLQDTSIILIYTAETLDEMNVNLFTKVETKQY